MLLLSFQREKLLIQNVAGIFQSSRLREDAIMVYTFTYKMLIRGGVINRPQLNGQMQTFCS